MGINSTLMCNNKYMTTIKIFQFLHQSASRIYKQPLQHTTINWHYGFYKQFNSCSHPVHSDA